MNSTSINLGINATMPFASSLHVYGYTAPLSKVIVQTVRTYGETTSDSQGFFEVLSLALSKEAKEICLESVDDENSVTMPVCLPLSAGTNYQNLGPILLPPTLSLSHNTFFIGRPAFASGKSLPSARLSVSLFNSRMEKKRFEVIADNNGKYNFPLPEDKILSWRLFTSGAGSFTAIPKTNTLFYSVQSLPGNKFNLLSVSLIVILLIMSAAGIYVLTIQKKFQPALLKVYLQQKLRWYNFRELLRQHHILPFHIYL